MQTAATRIALQLNSLNYAQQVAVRALVETLLLTATTETIHDILIQTDFLSDLAADTEESEQENISDESDMESTSSSSSGEHTSDPDEEQTSSEDEGNEYQLVDECSDMDVSEDGQSISE
ncbi:hypothetical protein VNI00_012322 [Paramarasmius palmivorus]|uniref:Uncharacterized protein n=1 Tax=Paramarasmius palmivorus TaxID=297713 RepID=A0AAW0C6S5_9AGAR